MAQITEASLSRYLAGKTEPRSAELLRMSRVLGVSMEWLISGRDSVPGTPVLSLREDPLPYGVQAPPSAPPKNLSDLDRRLNEVIEELREIKREIRDHKN